MRNLDGSREGEDAPTQCPADGSNVRSCDKGPFRAMVGRVDLDSELLVEAKYLDLMAVFLDDVKPAIIRQELTFEAR
ncbi:hypothetical protein BOSE21B_90294 [Bosea sp. 21B]|nr:hypothetical protein BOSE21B_90294 [Bosea sp. 21B]CAD5298415.1 hypothetical protein BOSE7B_60372 [Bosea sp. 7B]VXB35610.1 hypothetical protein BOSE127_110371 [Bosea sp. 127]